MTTRIRVWCFVAALLLPLAAGAGETPAESAILAARARLERARGDTERAKAWLALAAAHTKRARENGDPANYERALEALSQANAAGANAGEARRLEAWVRLGKHEFAAAEKLARQQTSADADDPDAWGLLGDALMELGRLDQAGDAYQHMMSLRPGPGAYVRAAYYRERAGDLQGAIDFQQLALSSTGMRESEERAWILVHVATLHENLRKPELAEADLKQALALFPEYHYALAGLAELCEKQGRHVEARDYAERAIAAAPHPERRLVLADALRALGDEAEARAQEQRFETEALANQERSDNENIFLVDYYLDRRPDPPRALAIAEREAARRPDPPTLERLARARARAGVTAQP